MATGPLHSSVAGLLFELANSLKIEAVQRTQSARMEEEDFGETTRELAISRLSSLKPMMKRLGNKPMRSSTICLDYHARYSELVSPPSQKVADFALHETRETYSALLPEEEDYNSIPT